MRAQLFSPRFHAELSGYTAEQVFDHHAERAQTEGEHHRQLAAAEAQRALQAAAEVRERRGPWAAVEVLVGAADGEVEAPGPVARRFRALVAEDRAAVGAMIHETWGSLSASTSALSRSSPRVVSVRRIKSASGPDVAVRASR